jgi:hypothetical protein
VNDAALESFAPLVHAEHGFEEAGKALQVFGFAVEFLPDGTLEKLRVVVVLEEPFEVREELLDDAVRTFGLPAFLGALEFILEMPVANQAVIFHRLGEDELVQELDDQFVVFAFVGETKGFKGAKPILKLLEEGAVKIGTNFAVFFVANDIEQALLGQSAFEQIGKGKFGERLERLPDIAGAVKEGVAQIGEDQIFGVAEVFLDLIAVPGRFQRKTFQQFRTVRMKQRFEFDND